MNINNQTILHVKAGHLPPDDMLEYLLEKKPIAFGFTVQSTFEGKPDLAVIQEDATNMTLSEFKQLFVNAKDDPISVWLGNLHAGYDPEDIQPFLIRDSNDDVFITITLEGDIIGNDADKKHTEQYNYVNGILIPKIVEWCEDFDGDLDKIAKKLTGDTFNREFLMHVGHRALLHIVPLEGDLINLGKNDLGLPDEEWGFVSQCQGFREIKEQKVNTEAVNDRPAAKRFWGGKKSDNAVLGADGKPIHDAGTKTSVPAVTPKSEQSYPADSKKAGDKDGKAPSLVARIPAWIKTNDDTKLWYDIVSGSVHPQWKKRLPCTIQDMEAAKIDNLADFKAYAMNKKLKPTGTITSSGKAPDDLKLISGVAGDKELPIIGPKELEKVLDFVAKHLDGNSKGIIPPMEMQAIEKQLPNFATAIGMKPEETINWQVGFLKGIGTTDIMALVLYAIMWRAIARPYVQQTTTHTVGATTVVTKTGENTTKVESHILAKDELKPAAKKTFWGGKGKAA